MTASPGEIDDARLCTISPTVIRGRLGASPRVLGWVAALLVLTAGSCDPTVIETTTTAGTTGPIPPPQHADGLLTGPTVGGGGPSDAGATTVIEVANLVIEDLEHFWAGHWPMAFPGVAFDTPSSYAIYERGQIPDFGCADSSDDPNEYVQNAYYCPRDASIVFEDRWFADLWAEHGDFGPTAILAHEWGHHVQNLLRDVQDPVFSIQTELQADCFAGVWARNAGGSGAFPVNSADIDEASATFYSVGHETTVGWFAPGVHGTPAERHNAFQVGYGSASASDCAALGDYRMDQTIELGPYVVGLLEGDEAATQPTGSVTVSGSHYGDAIIQSAVIPVTAGTSAQDTLLLALQTWAPDATAPHQASLYPYHAIESLTGYTLLARVDGTSVGFSYSQIWQGQQVHGYFFHHNPGGGQALVIDVFRPGDPPLDKVEWAGLVSVVWRMILSFQIP